MAVTIGRLASLSDQRAANLLRVPLFEIPGHFPGCFGESGVEKEVEIEGLDALADRIYGTPWTVAALVRSSHALSAVLVMGSPRRRVYHPDHGHYTERGTKPGTVAHEVRERLARHCSYYWYLNADFDPSTFDSDTEKRPWN